MTSWLNACKWNATSSGTGDFVVSSAVTGYQTPASAGAVNGAIYRYRAESVDLSQWEVGYGAYTVAGTTQARTTILVSSTGGSKVNFSASPIVGIVAVAEDMLNIASETQAESGTDNTTAMSPQAVAQAIQTNGLSFRNVAGRNGGLEVWQLGTSIAVAASATAYSADGFYLKTGANQACTVAQAIGLTNGSQFAAKVQRNSGQTGVGTIYFAIPLDTDELFKLRGNAVALSFVTKEGANQSFSHTITYNLYCGTGAVGKRGASAYAGETNPITGTVTTSGSAAAFVSAVSSAVATNITQAELQFSVAPSGTAGADDSFSIDDIDLRVVPAGIAAVKPSFERSDFIWDLQRCQRHYEKSYDYGTAPGTATSVGRLEARLTATPSRAFLMANFKQTKRVAPTMTGYSPATGSSGVMNDGTSDIGISSFAAGTQSAAMESNAPGNADAYLHWVADARI